MGQSRRANVDLSVGHLTYREPSGSDACSIPGARWSAESPNLASLGDGPMACSACLRAFRAACPLLGCALLLRLKFEAEITLLSREKGV
jgi:hypothetical protein